MLISDGAGELIETNLQRQLLDRGCKHEVTGRGEHHVNDPSDRVIQELDTMMRVSIHESNIPFKEWCFVVQYMCLIDITHIVGNLQVVFDSLFMSFKDKPITNPRLETLYRVLGRLNDRLKANSCNNGTVQSSDSGGNPKISDEGDSEVEGGLIPDIIQDDNNLVDDDTESSEDDVMYKRLKRCSKC